MARKGIGNSKTAAVDVKWKFAPEGLSGKVAWVTGAAQGIGAAVATRLRECGADVVMSDVDAEQGARRAADLGALFVECDVADAAANAKVVDAAIDRFGGLDLAFLNAGIATGMGVGDDFDVERYRRAMSINLDGVVFGAHAARRALLARGGGVIVATASMAGLVAVPFDPIYAANKHAVVGLARSLGAAWANEGVRVQALCPSFARTAIIGPIEEMLESAGFPILEVADVVSAFEGAVASGGSGECWFVIPGRDAGPFAFRNAPGPRGDG